MEQAGLFLFWTGNGSVFPQCEGERCALVYFRLRPYLSAVSMDDPLGGSEPDAGPVEIFLFVKPVERGKNLLGELLVESDPVVPDGIG